MTGFEQYPQAQLHALFSADTWDTLELAAKTRACQEVADRYAAQYGHAPCRVTHRSMEGAVYGYQSGSEIVLNSSLLAQGVFTTRYRDDRDNLRLVRTAVPAPAGRSWIRSTTRAPMVSRGPRGACPTPT